MKRITHYALVLILCAVLTVSALFQTVEAAEIESTDSAITGSSALETEPTKFQQETSNCEGMDSTGSPNSRSSEPDGKSDEF